MLLRQCQARRPVSQVDLPHLVIPPARRLGLRRLLWGTECLPRVDPDVWEKLKRGQDVTLTVGGVMALKQSQRTRFAFSVGCRCEASSTPGIL
jgi:hypothetical protein